MSIERNKEYEGLISSCLHEQGAKDGAVSFFIDTSTFAWPMVRIHADFEYKRRKFSLGVEMTFEDWVQRYAKGTAAGLIDMANQEIADRKQYKEWAKAEARACEIRARVKRRRVWRKFLSEHPLVGA